MENFQSAKGGDFRELTWSKARYLQPPPPVRLEYSFETGWYRHVPEDELEAAILLDAGGEQRGADDEGHAGRGARREAGEGNKSLTKMTGRSAWSRMASTFDRAAPPGTATGSRRRTTREEVPRSDDVHQRPGPVTRPTRRRRGVPRRAPVRMWHELTFEKQSEWQRHADEVNAKDKEDDA